MLAPELLEVLGCPLEDARPPFSIETGYLVCSVCGFGFAIVDGIPHLLPDDAIDPGRLRELLHGT